MLKSRIAERNDYTNVMELWERSVTATHGFLSAKDKADLKQEIPGYFPLVELSLWFNEEEQLIGFSGITGKHLEMLFIDPAYFRCGYGSQILQWLMVNKGIDSVDVNKENSQAKAFYLKNGFIIFSESPTDGQGRSYPILHLKNMDKQ